MLGAVIGDIIGSTYEWYNVKSEDFELFPANSRFTDDTVLSVAIAEKILNDDKATMNAPKSYALWYKQYYKRYPHAGFGQMFAEWVAEENMRIQRSFGNGAAMRVTAIGWAYDSLEEVLKEAKASCYYTHNHPEAIKGAKAVAAAVFMAKNQCDKAEIKKYLEKKFHYKFEELDVLRENYVFDSRASYSVPPAIEAFLESDSYESAIRKAVSIGGDSDTIACMAGGIAQAYYREIPDYIYNPAMRILDSGLKQVIKRFEEKYYDL